MKESASIAYSYIKANYQKFGIEADLKDNKNIFKDFDVHVHSPDGATPKDGPSAGVTFTTSLISALRKIPVSEKIGMTGEITLRGKILPIGGLREKSISAYRSGLEAIYIPKENLRDVDTLPKEITKNLKIIPVANFDELYKKLRKDHRI
jgi:ATP-dependent Lon protease